MDRTNLARGSFIYNLGLLFERISELHSSRPALYVSGRYSLTYAELDQLSARCARLLLKAGVTRHSIVCISGKKEASAYVALLACLRIGAGYAMLDDCSPVERLRRIIKTCAPTIMLLDVDLSARLHEDIDLSAIPSLTWDDGFATRLEEFSADPLEETLSVTGSDVAYLMFTSGSTGFPKGVAITHANVMNFVEWSRQCIRTTPEDVFTGVNPLFFDNSVFDIYSSLMTGAALASFDRMQVRDPGELIGLVRRLRCTVWFSVPSMLIFLATVKVLNSSAFPSVTRIVFGGEGYPKPKLKKLFELFGQRARLINVYGPTECTCICSAYDVSDSDFSAPGDFAPIGRIAPNFSFLIMQGSEPVIPGQVGELCLLGPNVGLGYFNEPERTKESFVVNPTNKAFREVMYRTGDLVQCSQDDGLIRFVGRADHQIKHMGYRIELQEIESALNLLPSVEEAAAVHGIANGFSRIVAVVGAKADVKESDIVLALKSHLPDYMIPQQVVIVPSLPKNQNGKIARAELASKIFGGNGIDSI